MSLVKPPGYAPAVRGSSLGLKPRRSCAYHSWLFKGLHRVRSDQQRRFTLLRGDNGRKFSGVLNIWRILQARIDRIVLHIMA